MGVHAVDEQLLRNVHAKLLRDAEQVVHGQRDLDLRQLYVVHLFQVEIQRGKNSAKDTRRRSSSITQSIDFDTL